MKNRILKRVVFFSLIIGCALASCNYDPSYKDETEALGWELMPAPLNSQESELIDSINKLGFGGAIKRPFIGRRGNRLSVYTIELSSDTFYVNQSNYTDLVQLRVGIINRLCKEIIADSVLFDTKEISFIYTLPDNKNGKYYKSGLSRDQFFPIETYPVDSVLKNCGIRIVKTKSGEYKRELIK